MLKRSEILTYRRCRFNGRKKNPDWCLPDRLKCARSWFVIYIPILTPRGSYYTKGFSKGSKCPRKGRAPSGELRVWGLVVNHLAVGPGVGHLLWSGLCNWGWGSCTVSILWAIKFYLTLPFLPLCSWTSEAFCIKFVFLPSLNSFSLLEITELNPSGEGKDELRGLLF